MKVYAYVKYIVHPRPENGGATRGDVSFIYPINSPQGSKDLDTFVPVVVDLKIPCGDKFTFIKGEKQWDCRTCKYNESDLCDLPRVSRGVWSGGTLLTPPKMIKKRAYSIDIDSLISSDSMALVENREKTEIEKALVYSRAVSNPMTVSVVKENY